MAGQGPLRQWFEVQCCVTGETLPEQSNQESMKSITVIQDTGGKALFQNSACGSETRMHVVNFRHKHFHILNSKGSIFLYIINSKKHFIAQMARCFKCCDNIV